MPRPTAGLSKTTALGLAVLMLAVVAGGCSSRRAAVYAAPALEAVLTDELVLMPIVDQRADRFVPFEIARDVRTATPDVLGKKGYTVVASAQIEGGERPPFEGFEELSADDLAALGPEGSATLLFLGVTEVAKTYGGGGDEYRVRVTGILVDKGSQSVVWRDTGSGTSNFGGLLSVLSPSGSQYDAVYEALTSLFRTVPDRVDRTEGPRRGKS